MAFLAKLFGKKKDNTPDEDVLVEEEGLTPEEPLDEDFLGGLVILLFSKQLS